MSDTVTLARAMAGGARVILRGHRRVHSPGAVAYRLVSAPERGIDPPELAGFFAPVVWRDGYGWRPAEDCGAPHRAGPIGLCADEVVTVVD